MVEEKRRQNFYWRWNLFLFKNKFHLQFKWTLLVMGREIKEKIGIYMRLEKLNQVKT